MRRPGLLALIGSGETSPIGGQVFSAIAETIQPPLSIAILETPAGFELNSSTVADRIGKFLNKHLQNYHPDISVIPARKKGTADSPDDAKLADQLISTEMIFLGPGSPSYAVRQLKGSLIWETIQAKHRLGTPIVLASAAAIAVGKLALPVYEIYKVGEDPHWIEGLDLLGYLGLNLIIIPHWNNNEGGIELDTSRCFMGVERFQGLIGQLEGSLTVLGIDENTGMLIDFEKEICQVMGRESIHLLNQGQEIVFSRGESFPMRLLGNYHWPVPSEGLPLQVWEKASIQHDRRKAQESLPEIPEDIEDLVKQREEARAGANWRRADALRDEIQSRGWLINDTPNGPDLRRDG